MEWWDEDKKKSLDTRILEALAYYRQYHEEPKVILLPLLAVFEDKYNLVIRTDKMVKANCVYIGHD
jgi:hypothetical protein